MNVHHKLFRFEDENDGINNVKSKGFIKRMMQKNMQCLKKGKTKTHPSTAHPFHYQHQQQEQYRHNKTSKTHLQNADKLNLSQCIVGNVASTFLSMGSYEVKLSQFRFHSGSKMRALVTIILILSLLYIDIVGCDPQSTV